MGRRRRRRVHALILKFAFLLLFELGQHCLSNQTISHSPEVYQMLLACLICNPKTAPVLVLHTEAKVLLLSQN